MLVSMQYTLKINKSISAGAKKTILCKIILIREFSSTPQTTTGEVSIRPNVHVFLPLFTSNFLNESGEPSPLHWKKQVDIGAILTECSRIPLKSPSLVRLSLTDTGTHPGCLVPCELGSCCCTTSDISLIS